MGQIALPTFTDPFALTESFVNNSVPFPTLRQVVATPFDRLVQYNFTGSVINVVGPTGPQGPQGPPGEGELAVGDYIHSTQLSETSTRKRAEGQLLLINNFPVLYGLIGTSYNVGGEDPLYFRLPDARSRVLMGNGKGRFITDTYALGSMLGVEVYETNHTHDSSFEIEASAISAHTGNLGHPDLVHSFDLVADPHSHTIPEGSTEGTQVEAAIDGTIPDHNIDYAISAHTGSLEHADHHHSVTTVTLSEEGVDINKHEDTIQEAVPHTHDVTTTDLPVPSGENVNHAAVNDTYTSSGFQVSIDLDLDHVVAPHTHTVDPFDTNDASIDAHTIDNHDNISLGLAHDISGLSLGINSHSHIVNPNHTNDSDPSSVSGTIQDHVIPAHTIDDHEPHNHGFSGGISSSDVDIVVFQPSLVSCILIKVA